jgi:hypothetical protein
VNWVDISIKMAALWQNFDLNIEILRVLLEQHTVQGGLCAKTHHLY